MKVYIKRAKEFHGARFRLMEMRKNQLVDMAYPLTVDHSFLERLQRKGIEIHDADYLLHRMTLEN